MSLGILENIRMLWRVLPPSRRKQLVGLQVLSVLAAIGEVANIGTLLPVLRYLSDPQYELRTLGMLGLPFQMLAKQNLSILLGSIFLATVILSTFLRILNIRKQLLLCALISVDLADRIFANVLRRPYNWHIRTNSSTILSYLTRDVDATLASIQAMLLLSMNFAIVLLLGGSLISLSPALMLMLALMLIGFYLVIFTRFRSSLNADGVSEMISYQKMIKVAQEGIGGIRDVLLDKTETFFLDSFHQSNLERKLSGAAINIKAQVPRHLIEAYTILIIIGVTFFLSLTGKGIQANLPLLGALALGSYRLLQPLQQCFASLSVMQANYSALERLEPFLGHSLVCPNSPLVVRSLETEKSPRICPVIQLSSVSFRYTPQDSWVLNNVSLTIKPNERIALIGNSGSGKSTTIDLILGLLTPDHGQVLLDSIDLHKEDGLLNAWVSRIAHVPQHIYLSDSSFAENIAFGLPLSQIDYQRVREAAECACISTMIESTADGYLTRVGERGYRLSGGQRQRIGIARALYKHASLLILDEATNALDTNTESRILESLNKISEDLTVILITHRISSLKECDKIFYINQSHINQVDSGTELNHIMSTLVSSSTT